jgi:uncharacterized protein
MDQDSPSEKDGTDFIEVRIDNVSISNLGFIVFLRHAKEGRVLPIFIGSNEAHSIAIALNGQPAPRPMTHDLMKTMLEALGWTISRIQVTHIEESTFFGRIFLHHEILDEMDFDARPSDAIALALRFHSPIHVHRKIYDEASVPMTQEGQDETETHVGIAMNTLSTQSGTSRPDPVGDLQKLLNKAVQEERYEEAAKLRDAIKRLQAGN